MEHGIRIPPSLAFAGRELRSAFAEPVSQMTRVAFVRAWCCIAYLFPALHPDDSSVEGNPWPRVLRRFLADAWRRAEAGELTEEELYPSDAQWCGLYDRMSVRLPEDTLRRLELAADRGIGDEP